MKMSARVAKLERHRLPRPPYVVRVNYPPTQNDADAIAARRSWGHSFAIHPFKSGSVAEWSGGYSPEAKQ